MKFYLFTAVASEGLLWLAGLAIFSSLISMYYYLQVIRRMYILPAPGAMAVEMHGNHGAESDGDLDHQGPEDEGEGEGYGQESDEHLGLTDSEHEDTGQTAVPSFRPSAVMITVMLVTLIGVFWVGVYPAPFLEAIDAASLAIRPGG